MLYHFFISHASEDKYPFVNDLAKKLRKKGYRVWYDVFSLTLGDSLSRSIDNGLSSSKYGIVVLSPNFFQKHWTQRELNGLVAREIKGKKVILPVWHNVNYEDIVKYSPTLADKRGVSTSRGLDYVVNEIEQALKQGIAPSASPEPELEEVESEEVEEATIKPEDFELRSERGVDYTKLRNLLAAGKICEADRETVRIMLQAAGSEEGWLRKEDIDNFPCEDLRTINQLWLHYSKGKFGFSVQKVIFENLGGTRQEGREEKIRKVKKFGRSIGWRRGGKWRRYSDLTFDVGVGVSRAHLPARWCGLWFCDLGWGLWCGVWGVWGVGCGWVGVGWVWGFLFLFWFFCAIIEKDLQPVRLNLKTTTCKI